jgi:DUF1016 N-terminal domain
MVHAYWLIGREIVEVEQQGKERAEYGDELIKHLSVRLAKRFGKGFSAPNLRHAAVLPHLPRGLCRTRGTRWTKKTFSAA